MTQIKETITRGQGGKTMKKYWWIIRTDDNCGLPYDTFVKWFNLPTLFYWLIKYRNTNYWCTFTWVDMESNIGESNLFVLKRGGGIMKITVKNYDDNKWDSMFYPDMRVLEVEHKGRKFELNSYGEIKLVYKDEIYYDLNEICSSEEELNNLYDELDVVHNNWYELRPIGEQYTKHIISGLYDDIFGDPTEITGELLDKYIKAEEVSNA